ncbi:hypothetical protein, partial [uncultured Thiodictyon sp.]|uniref:hypothetical protein n=1 Tax=uncultured Thiodictyon sp. TaxID=1846217 RepID=UPI0025F2DE25
SWLLKRALVIIITSLAASPRRGLVVVAGHLDIMHTLNNFQLFSEDRLCAQCSVRVLAGC